MTNFQCLFLSWLCWLLSFSLLADLNLCEDEAALGSAASSSHLEEASRPFIFLIIPWRSPVPLPSTWQPLNSVTFSSTAFTSFCFYICRQKHRKGFDPPLWCSRHSWDISCWKMSSGVCCFWASPLPSSSDCVYSKDEGSPVQNSWIYEADAMLCSTVLNFSLLRGVWRSQGDEFNHMETHQGCHSGAYREKRGSGVHLIKSLIKPLWS